MSTTGPDTPRDPGTPSALELGPLAGVTPPRPPDPAQTALLTETASTGATPTAVTTTLPGDLRTGATAVTTDAPTGRRSPRIRTVVLGVVLLVVAATVLVSLLLDVTVDGGAVLLGVLLLAGVALLGGGLAAAAKEARGGPGA